MNYGALIIIDMQTALVETHPYNEKVVIANIAELLSVCRTHQVPVIYIAHDGGKGDELEYGCEGWQIHKELAPLPHEKIFDKRYNSAFRQTGLQAFLDTLGAKNLILCGMQSEYCFDVTCKVAFEFEHNITIPQGTTTTFDNELASGKAISEYYENKIWNNRYARVIPLADVILEIQNEHKHT